MSAIIWHHTQPEDAGQRMASKSNHKSSGQPNSKFSLLTLIWQVVALTGYGEMYTQPLLQTLQRDVCYYNTI